jgi:NodT family efflux transporter outer membrane factor (OMF) lipoprotein
MTILLRCKFTCWFFLIVPLLVHGTFSPALALNFPLKQHISQLNEPNISSQPLVAPPPPDTYQALKTETHATLDWVAQFPLLRWWEALGDEQLNYLVVKAMANNPSLLMQRQDVAVAQATVKSFFAKELPHLQIGANFSRQKNAKNLTTPSQAQFSGSGPRLFAPGQTVNIYNLPLSASYDLDPFLKKRLATKSAQATLEATQLRYRLAQLTLSTQVVQAYTSWLKANSEQITLQQELLLLEQELRLNELQYAQGLVLRSPINTLEQNETLLREALKTAETQQFQWGVALATLTGETAGVEPLKPKTLPALSTLQKLPLTIGVPANLVENRLDVLASAFDLKAAGLDVQTAKRAFFPTISLTGQVGLASTKINNWFSWDSLLTNAASSITQPLFQGGALKADLSAKKARYQQQIFDYKATLLKAYEAVENQLATLQNLEARSQQVLRSKGLAEQNVNFSQARFKQGLSDYKPVVQAQQTVLQTEKQLLNIQESTLKTWSQLMLEVGGGSK